MKRFVPARVPLMERERTTVETLADFDRRPEWYRASGLATRKDVVEMVRRACDEGDRFGNGDYLVTVYRDAALSTSFPTLDHLSIKRVDREPIHDWRELQAIKSALYSPEHEAVELYPAESRVVDTANQYHLFVLVARVLETGELMKWPFGFLTRLVTDEPGAKAKQRPGSGAGDLR